MDNEKIWEPSAALKQGANITAYIDWLKRKRGKEFASYDELWNWSVSDLEGFWASIWDYFAIRSTTPYASVLSSHKMPGAHWLSLIHI